MKQLLTMSNILIILLLQWTS